MTEGEQWRERCRWNQCEVCCRWYRRPGRGRPSDYCSKVCKHYRQTDLRGRAAVRPRSCDLCGYTVAMRGDHARCASCRTATGWRTPPDASPITVVRCSRCAVACTRRGRSNARGFCPPCRVVALRDANRRKNYRRRVARVGRYTLAQVASRDGGRCHICRKKVDMRRPGTHPRGPTIDHLIPIAVGGVDDLTNVSLAHRLCNVKRGTGGVAQLRFAA